MEGKYMMNINIIALFMIPIYFSILAIILYFLIKLAVKNAIKELKDDRIL